MMDVYIDGEKVDSVNTQQSPRKMGAILYTTPDLEYGTHTIKLARVTKALGISKIWYADGSGIFTMKQSEYDLMYGGTWFYPVHQNVIWTFILGLLGIHIMETVRKKKKTPVFVLTAILVTIAGGLLGTLTMVDYYGIGVLTVFIFYFFHGRKWWCLLGQIAALYWVNVELLGGLMYPVRLFGMEFELCQQGLALLALVPIWLYRGRQGYHSKPFQYFCYAFYPVHMLILVLILGFVNR